MQKKMKVSYPRKLKKHREIAISLGLPGMGISKESGGLGLNMFEQMIVWEQLGRVTNALCWCFSEAQDWMENNFTDYQKENYFKPLLNGTKRKNVMRLQKKALVQMWKAQLKQQQKKREINILLMAKKMVCYKVQI